MNLISVNSFFNVKSTCTGRFEFAIDAQNEDTLSLISLRKRFGLPPKR